MALRRRSYTVKVPSMKRPVNEIGGVVFFAMLAFLIVPAAGCRTLTPLPPANLSEPGWTVRQGQAVWRSGRGMPEIAGELLVATRPGGNEFIQFTKTPFPLVIAQKAANHWQIQFSTENKRFAGLGKPPARLIWLWLSPALSGQLPAEKWSWHQNENGWGLENRGNGERLEGYFTEGSSGTR